LTDGLPLDIGRQAHQLAKQLWPINRSITGDGVRETLKILCGHLPNLKILEVPSGQKVFDWKIPKEWSVREAWIEGPDGRRFCDFNTNNLHLVGYSGGIDATVTKNELDKHLFSLPEKPKAIPYITSYYEEFWGFCITDDERQTLQDGNYKVYIDAELFEGSLTYGELIIGGKSDKEVFLSTYVCHPSMANNELSGPCVVTFLAKWLINLQSLKYTYRIVFVPETIGSIAYLSKNLDAMRANVVAGFNVTCIGDERAYSYIPSRNGETISDKVAKHVLRFIDPDFVQYSWADRGSDERQYCAPHVDLPIASILRSKFLSYDEYHTSLDDLETVVTEKGLAGGFEAIRCALEVIENNVYPNVTVLCEPQLGRRGLYPNISDQRSYKNTNLMMNLVSHSDGQMSLLEIADKCDVSFWEIHELANKLADVGVLDLGQAPRDVS
jgi:aminopeptidase-like protein